MTPDDLSAALDRNPAYLASLAESEAQAERDYAERVDLVWTEQKIRALGVRTDLRTAAAIFGVSPSTAYRLAADGDFPCEIVRVGAQYVVPVAAILRTLGLGPL